MPNTKFRPILLISILFFLLIFLSAFDNEPASPSPRLPTPTPTSVYAIPSWQPREVEPLTITTPDAPVDQYILADWNAETAQLALSNPGIHEEEEIYRPNAYFTLLEESNLRYPSMVQDESFIMELAKARNHYSPSFTYATSDAFSTLPMYSKLLENSLNQGSMQPDNIAEWIHGNMAVLQIDTIQTSNLFGNGKPVWAYHLITSDKYKQVIFFVAKNEDGTFTVSTFADSKWENRDPKYCELRAQDLNGNGVPEIILERVYWSQFGLKKVFKDIAIYEWDGQQFIALQWRIPSVHYFSTDYEENKKVWTFKDQQDGTAVIIGKQTTLTVENCPDYNETYHYIWTGRSFEFDHIDVQPLPENTSSECKIKWALTATQNQPESIQALTEALDDWPDSLDNEIGPASQDYFRLWLAETYALHGENDNALRMLDVLIKNPENPQYTGIPEMAEVYKNSYIKSSPYMACKTLEEWKENELHNAYELSRSSDLDAEKILFEQWGVYVEEFQSGKSCVFYSNFPTVLEHQAFSSRNQLVSWLDQNQIQWNGLNEIDMNQDGLEDWLVIIQTDFVHTQLWALIQKENYITPMLIGQTRDDIKTLQTTCHQYIPEDDSAPVQIYRLGSKVVAFQIIDQANHSYPFMHFDIGDISEKSTSVRSIEQDKNTITLFFNHYQNQYQWHDQHQRFQLLFSTADESKSPSLEKLLFVDHNPQAVIDELETWFVSIDPNTDNAKGSYLIEYTLPYNTYLLGLAYELNGDEQNAVQTYYNLWQTYPERPFAIIARYKLEKME